MEAIRNYLDTMFANLPGTQSVLRAKEELWQMMEDKYTELINEGKSENEAVGSVISEFGNLSELAEALGLEEEIKVSETEEKTAGGRILTVEDAKDFIKERGKQAVYLSLGVAICIMSVICPVIVSVTLPDNLDFIGAIGLFAVVMIGVGLIIYANTLKRKWAYIREEKCTLSMDTTKYVTEERAHFDGSYVTELIIGICVCAAAWVPGAVIDEFVPNSDSLTGVFFFLMVAIGVFLIIHVNRNQATYKKLLKLNKKGTMKAGYTSGGGFDPGKDDDLNEEAGERSKGEDRQKKPKYISPVAETFMDLYWPTVICLYLCASFITFRWGLTWVIWPAAGIIHGVFSRYFTE